MARRKTRKVTSAKAWRTPRDQGEVIELPSGKCARIRSVALDSLIAQGELPDLLTPLASQTLWREMTFEDIADDGQLAKGYIELINAVLPAAFIKPKIVALEDLNEDSDDEITLADLAWTDKTHVFQLVLLPTEALESFRKEQERDVEPVPDSKSQQDEAE